MGLTMILPWPKPAGQTRLTARILAVVPARHDAAEGVAA